MSRKKNTSLLYDPELSMSEEQLRREIDEINRDVRDHFEGYEKT